MLGLWSKIKQWLVLHLLIGYVFVFSGLIVCFLMLLAYIFIWPWNKTIYRKIVVNLAYTHWCQFTFLAQWWSGSDAVVFLEDLDILRYIGKEHTLTIMNHKYDIDWLMAWILSERFKMLGGTKIYGKSTLRLVPLIGWAWTFTESIFLKREWEKDREIISRDLKYLVDYPEDYWVTLLLFCEGTRFTDAKHAASNEVARKKGLPELRHHLLPRTRGFTLSMHGIKGKVPSILDLTIGFRKDGAAPTLMNILQGKACKAEMYVRRIPTDVVPLHSDEACANWLHKFYQEKDEIYENFAQNGQFTIGERRVIPKRYNDLIMYFFWAIALCVPLFYYGVSLFLSGSIYIQLGFIVVVVLASIGVRLMIAVTETDKGSAYGVVADVSQSNKDKKEH